MIPFWRTAIKKEYKTNKSKIEKENSVANTPRLYHQPPDLLFYQINKSADKLTFMQRGWRLNIS